MKSCQRHSRFPMYITMLTLAFLYLPLIPVAIDSFNVSRYGCAWHGVTLQWYKQLIHTRAIWEALVNTIFIALVSTFFSTILGTLAALALNRAKSRLTFIYYGLVHTPLVVPDILQGISLLLLFVPFFCLELGMTTIIIAHITFCISYVTMVVLERLHEFDSSLFEAAQDLGASGTYTFFHVTLPLILPGVIAGALFAFMLSIDDFVITFFVGSGVTTLPLYIESTMRRGNTAVINALSVIFLVITFILVLIAQKCLTQNSENKK